MNPTTIFIPFFGMMLLTLCVWLYMYYHRISFMMQNNIDPQLAPTAQEMQKLFPDRINYPSENLLNLFEMPVLFYACCLYLYVTHQVDALYLLLAYGYLFFRIGHSVVHSTSNRVMIRFWLYILSSITLWMMIIRAFIELVM